MFLNARHRPSKPRRQRSLRPAIEAIEPRVVPATFWVTNVQDDGFNSLRAAIENSNATPGHDSIAFDLADVSGPNVIELESSLPPLTDSVDISAVLDSPTGGIPTVGLTLATQGDDGPTGTGFEVQAPGCRIAGFAIYGISHGIVLANTQSTSLQYNWLGLDLDGEAHPGTMYHGVRLSNANHCDIEDNVIAGCIRESIWSESPNSAYNAIRGNKIGTDPTGRFAAGNESDGIHLGIGSHDFTIEENVISGNRGSGIVLSNAYGVPSHDNRILKNWIGVNWPGYPSLGNGWAGIVIVNSPGNLIQENQIGASVYGIQVAGDLATGTVIDLNKIGRPDVPTSTAGIRIETSDVKVSRNDIRYNDGVGISVVGDTTHGARITDNAIDENGGLGIDLGDDGVTPNDPGDLDDGPNGLINFPNLIGARPLLGETRINGTYVGKGLSTFTLEFFASHAGDPSGNGEGSEFLGSTTVTTDDSGFAAFDAVLPWETSPGWVVTATATGADGSTSEFSAPVPAERPVAVASVRANDGSAQRSRVTSLQVRFDGLVDEAGVAPWAFLIERKEGGSLTPSIAWSTSGGDSIATLTFSGELSEFDSLIDGRYTLTIDGMAIPGANGVPIDADGDGAAAGIGTVSFFRLFGDIDGDRDVDNTDFLRFRGAMNSTSPSPLYVGALDFNGDGKIDALDLAQFNLRRGVKLP